MHPIRVPGSVGPEMVRRWRHALRSYMRSTVHVLRQGISSRSLVGAYEYRQ